MQKALAKQEARCALTERRQATAPPAVFPIRPLELGRGRGYNQPGNRPSWRNSHDRGTAGVGGVDRHGERGPAPEGTGGRGREEGLGQRAARSEERRVGQECRSRWW